VRGVPARRTQDDVSSGRTSSAPGSVAARSTNDTSRPEAAELTSASRSTRSGNW
jgi:hypothetical protein